MTFYTLIINSLELYFSKLRILHHLERTLPWPFQLLERFKFTLNHIQWMQIIVVLVVEATKHDEATSHKTCCWFPSWYRHTFSLNFQCSDILHFRIKNDDIIEIVAESTTKDVDFTIINWWCMSPSQNAWIFPSFPCMSFNFPPLDEIREINRVDIADTPIFGVTASNNKKLISNHTRRMKSSATRLNSFLINLNFLPFFGFEVEDP